MRSATAQTPLRSSSPAAFEAAAALAVYVHWPFCARKCPYCDFNSHVREAVDEARWRRALTLEIAHAAARLPAMRTASIFFGGGTPSLMSPDTVAAVIEAVLGHWPAAGEPEITLEANPSSVEAERFAGYRDAGIDRLSLGVQGLDDDALAFLGRLHGRAEAVAALELAQATFERVSFDMIYARPGQTRAAWRAELAEALALAGEHLSLYQLTIEPGTAFHRQEARGALRVPDGDTAAALYELTQEMTAAAGLLAYEISNHARPGAESRHNLAYWQAAPWLGIGPGAHGRLPAAEGGTIAQARIRRPEDWLAAVERHGHGTAAEERLDPAERAREALMTGLRLTAGIDERLFARRCDLPLDAAIDPHACTRLVEAGLLERPPGRLKVTPRGRLLLDSILGALLG